MSPAIILAIPLYHFSIFDLGFPLLAFFTNLLIFGWVIGLLVTSLLLRFGVGAESLAWALIFLIAPVSAIYYPVSILPNWLQWIAWMLPPAHVFEGMRAILVQDYFEKTLLFSASTLNLGYLIIATMVFLYNFNAARREGRLLQIGE